MELYDDGSPKLRPRRVTDDHPSDCPCQYCRTLCCVPCHIQDPTNTKVWRSITGFGAHLKAYHPAWATHAVTARRTRRIVKALQDVNFAKQAQRFERTGLRKINLKRLDERSLKATYDWIRKIEANPLNNLLLNSIQAADERLHTKATYESAVRKVTADVESGIKSGVFVTTERQSFYDPRVALEILKLMWAWGRGWSTIQHFLLMYGINALADQLRTEGISLPIRIRTLPEPHQIIREQARHLDIDNLDER